jgi:hypothetical protein
MNERLTPCELTQPDTEIWLALHLRLGRVANFLWTRSLMQDGCDAALMSRCQHHRVGPMAWRLEMTHGFYSGDLQWKLVGGRLTDK